MPHRFSPIVRRGVTLYRELISLGDSDRYVWIGKDSSFTREFPWFLVDEIQIEVWSLSKEEAIAQYQNMSSEWSQS
jgi:hypothetical protein